MLAAQFLSGSAVIGRRLGLSPDEHENDNNGGVEIEMGFFKRLLDGGSEARSTSGPLVDASLPDGQWLARSESVYNDTIQPYYGSPETMARGGDERLAQGDEGVALFFFRKSIDMLHTAYGFNQMEQRRPSQADAAILGSFCASLESSVRAHPEAPVDETVREVTHRLRSISTECEQNGIDARIYRESLTRIAAATPKVRIDDVLWT